MRFTLTWLRLDARRRWRSLAVLALLVLLATTTVLAAIAGARRGDSAVGRLLDRTLPATITVLPNKAGFNWQQVRELPEVASLATFAIAGFRLDGYPASLQNETSFPPGGDLSVMRTIERPVVLAGRVFDPRRPDEVVVTPRFPAQYGKGVGDTLTLDLATPEQIDHDFDFTDGRRPAGPRVRVRIVGVVRSFWYSEKIGSLAVVVPSPALYTRYRANFMGHPGAPTFRNALVRLKDGVAGTPAFRADLARVTHRTDIDIWNNVADFGSDDRRVAGYEAACLLAFGLAALAAALFLVGQAAARYTAAAVADLQLLRAPGITPGQVIAAASAGPFLAGLAGTAGGVAGAVVASRWMPIGIAALLEPQPGFDADWLVLGTGAVIAPLALLAGCVLAASAAVTASQPGHQRQARRSALAAGMDRAGLPVPAVIGTRFALEPGRGRSAVPARPALIGAIAGVLGVLAAFTFAAGVSDAAVNPTRFGQTYQLGEYIGLSGHQFAPAGPALLAVARDRDVTGVNDALTAVAYSGNTSISAYSYRPVGGPGIPVVLTAGRMPRTPAEAVLAPLTARALHAGPGSTVRLTGSSGPHNITVTGIGFVPEGVHNGYAAGAWLTPGGYRELFRGAPYAYKFRVALVALRPGTDLTAAAARLGREAARAAGVRKVQFGPIAPPDELTQIRDVAELPVALAGFLVLLAVGAVGHALATAVRRRRHELAVLRALGLTRTQARLVIITQASVLALAGLAFGIPLGLALGHRLWGAVAQATPLAYHTPFAVWALLLAVPAGLLIANLLAVWPGHRAATLPSAQVLRAE